jgi:hypothetical protein
MPREIADSLVNRHVSEHDLFSMEETGSITSAKLPCNHFKNAYDTGSA